MLKQEDLAPECAAWGRHWGAGEWQDAVVPGTPTIWLREFFSVKILLPSSVQGCHGGLANPSARNFFRWLLELSPNSHMTTKTSAPSPHLPLQPHGLPVPRSPSHIHPTSSPHQTSDMTGPWHHQPIFHTVWCQQKDRHIDQWDRTENPEINPHIYAQLMFKKDGKTIQWGRIIFSTNDDGKTGTTCKRLKKPLPHTTCKT